MRKISSFSAVEQRDRPVLLLIEDVEAFPPGQDGAGFHILMGDGEQEADRANGRTSSGSNAVRLDGGEV